MYYSGNPHRSSLSDHELITRYGDAAEARKRQSGNGLNDQHQRTQTQNNQNFRQDDQRRQHKSESEQIDLANGISDYFEELVFLKNRYFCCIYFWKSLSERLACRSKAHEVCR